MAKQQSTIRALVEARAQGRCEYCRRYQDLIGDTFFEVEHTVPRSRGGSTVPHNLAFACRRCNLLKGSVVDAYDARTGRIVRLFDPRRDAWHEHFRRSRDLLRVYGRTASGRATVSTLRLNSPAEQKARKLQRDHLADVFPLD